MSLSHIERMTYSFSLHRRVCSSSSTDRMTYSFSIQRGECLFIHKAESVPVLYVEETDSFSVQGRDYLLYTSERVSLCHM